MEVNPEGGRKVDISQFAKGSPERKAAAAANRRVAALENLKKPGAQRKNVRKAVTDAETVAAPVEAGGVVLAGPAAIRRDMTWVYENLAKVKPERAPSLGAREMHRLVSDNDKAKLEFVYEVMRRLGPGSGEEDVKPIEENDGLEELRAFKREWMKQSFPEEQVSPTAQVNGDLSPEQVDALAAGVRPQVR
jgi:hypothetical protein